jgi:hypothetical protein
MSACWRLSRFKTFDRNKGDEVLGVGRILFSHGCWNKTKKINIQPNRSDQKRFSQVLQLDHRHFSWIRMAKSQDQVANFTHPFLINLA